MSLWLLTNKELVKNFIDKYPVLRDDDRKLISSIWLHELIKLGVSKEDARKVLIHYAEGRLTNAESIRRSRQIIESEEKQSNRYDHRQDLSEQVRQSI